MMHDDVIVFFLAINGATAPRSSSSASHESNMHDRFLLRRFDRAYWRAILV